MKKYWIAITNDENWELIKLNNVYAVKTINEFNRLTVGDKLILYLKPKKICAVYEVLSLKSNNYSLFKDTQFQHSLNIRPVLTLVHPFEINNKKMGKTFIKNISIFKNARKWGTVLMGRSIIEITQNDYKFIKKEMEKYASI
jgi:predicted RNA-binding protein